MRHFLVGAGFVGAIVGCAFAQTDFSKVEISTTKVGEGLYMVQGAGGNMALSVGTDGAFLVDDQFAPLAPKIEAAIGGLTDKKLAFILNTHWHGDHAGGNEPLAAKGARIVAHDNVRKRLKEGLKRENGETPPAPAGALPVVTFADAVTFHWNGDTVRAHHVADAHTDGDAFVYFEGADVLHMGDVFFNGGFPFIDLASGGTLDGYIAAQETALAIGDADTKIIPGHGALAGKAELAASVAMLRDVRARIAKLVKRGLDEDSAIKAKPLADLADKWGKGFIDADAMTRTAYRSLKPKKN